jgi:hypothetical protein
VLLCGPTLAAVQKVRPSTREKFFHAHHAVREETLANRMAAINAAVPFTTEQAVRHASGRMLKAFATQMKPTIEAIRACDHEMEKLCRTPQDDHLLAALPGAGPG